MAAYAEFTLADLQTRLGDRRDSSTYWSAEEDRRWLNAALSTWNLLTGQWRVTGTWAFDAGDPYAPLPGALVWPRRLLFNAVPLVFTEWYALQATVPTWRTDAVGDTGVPTSPQLWAPISRDLVIVWPRQAGTLTFDGLSATPTLTNAGDYIDLNESYLDALLDYTRHLATFKEGGARFQATLSAWVGLVTAAGDQNPDLTRTAFYQNTVNPPQPAQPVWRRVGPRRPASQVRT